MPYIQGKGWMHLKWLCYISVYVGFMRFLHFVLPAMSLHLRSLLQVVNTQVHSFLVVPAPQYKQGSCVCASVLWFSVCALYECVYSRPKTMALSDYISLSVEAVKGGQENSHWLPLPSLLSGPTLWLAQATYIFRAWVHQNSLQLSNSAQELYTVWRAGVTKH